MRHPRPSEQPSSSNRICGMCSQDARDLPLHTAQGPHGPRICCRDRVTRLIMAWILTMQGDSSRASSEKGRLWPRCKRDHRTSAFVDSDGGFQKLMQLTESTLLIGPLFFRAFSWPLLSGALPTQLRGQACKRPNGGPGGRARRSSGRLAWPAQYPNVSLHGTSPKYLLCATVHVHISLTAWPCNSLSLHPACTEPQA